MSALERLFVSILNMSITASYVALGVMAIRVLLRKAPKVFSYVLWAVVLFRLVCPFSFPSPVSLLALFNADAANGMRAEYVPQDIGYMPEPAIRLGVDFVDRAVNKALPVAEPIASSNPMQVWVSVLRMVWLLGILLLVVYSIVSYIKILSRLRTATVVSENIYETDQISTAVVCGFIRPKIFVPIGVKKEDLPYILEHERTHIRRYDYLVKPLAFLAVIVHWFNPVVWLSFALMSKDMEMSCDEAVLGKMGDDTKLYYSGSLLSLSMQRSGLALASPLAFSESDVKSRIKNVINYKRPGFWVVAVTLIAVAAALVAFAGNPLNKFNIDKVQARAKLFETAEQDLVKIGEAAVYSYYSTFMVKGVPTEYRMLDYKITRINLMAGDSQEFCVGVVSDYSTTTMYFFSANGSFRPVSGAYECTGDYKQFRIKNLGNGRYQIVGIGTGGLDQGLSPVNPNETTGRFNFTAEDATTLQQRVDSGDAELQALLFPQSAAALILGLRGGEFASEPLSEAPLILKYNWESYWAEIEMYQPARSGQGGIWLIKSSQVIDAKLAKNIEGLLADIMSSPQSSSNPEDYINANRNEYEDIIKGGRESLLYLLAQFEAGNSEGLRGQIMMRLCKDLLGKRNNVTDDSLSPAEWYNAFSIRMEIVLPDFKLHVGDDLVEKLVYAAETAKNSQSGNGFTVVAPRIFGQYEEGELLKVFVTTYSARYRLYENVLDQVGGSVVPGVITFKKDTNGNYQLHDHVQARDGSEFAPSIRKFCTVNGREVPGLAEEMLRHYSNYQDLNKLQWDNLYKHLQAHGITDATLTDSYGNVLFSMNR